MVHGLATLRKINNVKPEKKPPVVKPKVPDYISLNPAAARQFLNRPWRKARRELPPDGIQH